MSETEGRLTAIRLVPVEVFGADNNCCIHEDGGECPKAGYGLSDAVQPWSDCNRAIGRIYRRDDADGPWADPGDTVTVYVRPEDVQWFERRFGDG